MTRTLPHTHNVLGVTVHYTGGTLTDRNATAGQEEASATENFGQRSGCTGPVGV